MGLSWTVHALGTAHAPGLGMQANLPSPDLSDPVQRLDPNLDPAGEVPFDLLLPPDEPLDDDAAQAGGQNWVEALETAAIENGSDQPIDQLIHEELDDGLAVEEDIENDGEGYDATD